MNLKNLILFWRLGIRLSGGQKKVTLKAVAKKPSILILDEATSNLDSNSEILIQNSIKELSKNITIIIIAHRYSSIKIQIKYIF